MARRRTPEERQALLDDAYKRLAEGVENLRTGEGWKAWLDTAVKFRTYSLKNQLLIHSQMPDASQVAGRRTWNALGRHVVKGETSIRILAPSTRKVKDTDAQGNVRRGEDGQPIKVDRLLGFRAVPVFDVSQTQGEPLPEPPQPKLLEGHAPPGMWDGLAIQVHGEGFALTREATTVELGGANGVTQYGTRTVTVASDLSDAQAAKTLAHELAHVRLHDPDNNDGQRFACRGAAEVEAESVAYLVGSHAGLNTGEYSFAYVAGWATTVSSDALAATADRIRSAAEAIIEQLPDPADDAPAIAVERPTLTWAPAPVSDLPPPTPQPAISL